MESNGTEYQTVYIRTDENLTTNLCSDDLCNGIIVDSTDIIDDQILHIGNKENMSDKNESISIIVEKESANSASNNCDNVSEQPTSYDETGETRSENAFVDDNEQSCNVFDQNMAMYLDQYMDSNINYDLRSPKESNQNSSTVPDKDSAISLDKNATIVDHESMPIDGIVENLQRAVEEESQLSKFKTLCSYCSKKFSRIGLLRKHLQRVHKFPASPYSCPHCKVAFKYKAKLQVHCKEAHQQKLILDTSCLNDYSNNAISERDKGQVKCVECNIKFANRRILRDHLAKHHNLNIAEQEICFPNMIAFKKWKLDIERRERTYFHAAHGMHKGSKCNRCLYRCHRSGIYHIQEQEKKTYHSLGTKRTGITCTAMMIVYEYPEEVRVKYCLQHYGHGQDINFVQLSEEEQAAVNGNCYMFNYSETCLNGTVTVN